MRTPVRLLLCYFPQYVLFYWKEEKQGIKQDHDSDSIFTDRLNLLFILLKVTNHQEQ